MKPGGFGLYLHWPFCQAKCPYCDFNSHVSAHIDQKRWQAAYLQELDRAAEETNDSVLETVFFGGGTPSLMDPEVVHAIIERIRRNWRLVNDPEISLEANPTSVEAARFAGFRDAGVNRISMGVQALDDRDLRRLGRLHSAKDARTAFDTARSLFDRVSFDLIYARQDQSLEAWEKELREALGMAVDHLSLYQLTIEDGTAFGARHAAGGLKGLPDDDTSADMYLMTQDITGAAGFHGYEISNHARVDAQSRHNLVYWRGGDYIGIGPGAHGRLTLGNRRFATETELNPLKWLLNVERLGSGETLRDTLPLEEQALEYLMMSLRLSEGTDIVRYRGMGGTFSREAMQDLNDLGLIEFDETRLRATSKGRPVLNGLLRNLIAE